MLDTIILQIPIRHNDIIRHEKFSPSTKEILNDPRLFIKFINNPTKTDKEKGIYKPRLTVIKRGSRIYLKIEFSAPKLLFGNNLDETEEKDFETILRKLQEKILEMGISLQKHQIENAGVISFHPSKNIPISKGYTSSFVIRELSKIDLNQKLDLERVSFRNDGESLQLYSNRHSFVLYDKISDLNKPAKRAIDKDQTKLQLDLFNHIKQEKMNLEVLRLEVRLSHKRKMKEVLEKVGFTDTPLFRNIFNKNLCRKIVKLYWDNFFGKNLFLFNVNDNAQRILQIILMRYPKINIKTALMLVGLYKLSRDKEGIRNLRNIIKSSRPNFNWTTINNYLKKFDDEMFIKPLYEFIEDIEREINNFEAFKINKEGRNKKVINLQCKQL